MLVFPAVYRAGLIGGAEYGDGVLRIAGKTVGYDNFAGLSFSPQIGGPEDVAVADVHERAGPGEIPGELGL